MLPMGLGFPRQIDDATNRATTKGNYDSSSYYDTINLCIDHQKFKKEAFCLVEETVFPPKKKTLQKPQGETELLA